MLSAEFSTKMTFDLSIVIQKLLVFIKNYSTIYDQIKRKLTKAKLDQLTQNGVTP